MGMYPQPNRWQCGPFALKHALIMLGVIAEEKEITKITRTRKGYGTDERQLLRAAEAFDCDLPTVRRSDEDRARRTLIAYLRRRIPVLLCIDRWAHWVTIVKYEQGRFIVFDSEDRRVMVLPTWAQLKNRWVYTQRNPDDYHEILTWYDLHPVVPRFRVQTRAQLSLARVRHLRRRENQEIPRLWNQYVADLLDICKVRTPLSAHVLSLGEFLRRHEAMIIDQVATWHGDVDRKKARKILRNLRFVADTLGMIIPETEEKRAIATLAVLLTLWAEGERERDPIYVPPKVRKRRKTNW